MAAAVSVAAPLEPLNVPPNDPEAEASVISAVILDAAAMPRIVDFLRPEQMFSEAHRRILEACADLFARGEPIDVQTVASWLRARNRLAQVGGAGYVSEVLAASPVVANVRAHAVAVHDAWRRRQVIATCQRIAAQGYVAVGDVQAWCDQAIRDLAKIGAQNPVRPVESNDQALARMLAEAFEVEGPEAAGTVGSSVTGFPTGIHGLDEILGGCHKGAKTTIAATTGAGKTTIAFQVAVRWAKRGIGVLFFSTEMKREALLMRAVCAETGIAMDRVKKRRLSAADRAAMTAAAQMIAALPLKIDQTAKITIDEIIGIAKTESERMPIVNRVPLGAVIVDYAQRLEPPRHIAHKEKKDWVAHSTKAFKQMCQDLDVAGIELAQAKPIDRDVRKRQKPQASNGIAESSAIAHEADNVVFLVSESEGTPNDPRQEVTAYVAKQRNGRKGEVSLLLRGDIFTFIDPNAPNPMASPGRQYIDTRPEPEPPPGRFDDDHPLTEGLLR